MSYLWYLAQSEKDGYDTYDSCVVCAPSKEEAVKYTPEGYNWDEDEKYWRYPWGTNDKVDTRYMSWASYLDNIECTYLGVADGKLPLGIVIASFNAG